MKIIFLDFDGVLNSEAYSDFCKDVLGYDNGYGGFFQIEDDITREVVKFDPLTLRILQYILDETDAKIVISSTWRELHPLHRIKEMLALYGIDPDRVIGVTASNGRQAFRGDEVNLFLRAYDSYVILDDGTDFYPDQTRVQTNPDIGLTWNDADAAIRHLNR